MIEMSDNQTIITIFCDRCHVSTLHKVPIYGNCPYPNTAIARLKLSTKGWNTLVEEGTIKDLCPHCK